MNGHEHERECGNFEVDVTISRVPDCFSELFPRDATSTFDSSLFFGMHQCVQSYFIKCNFSETEVTSELISPYYEARDWCNINESNFLRYTE